MEEAKKKHTLQLVERKSGLLTGITEVYSFDDKEILLDTLNGTLAIHGENLAITRLFIEQGEIDIAGQIDSILYSKNKEQKKEKGKRLLGRMFQ